MAKILMIDDDVDFLAAAKQILVGSGHDVSTCNNATDGETKIAELSPELILLDVMMESPDDGIALAQKLRKNKVEIPIIMLSGVSKVMGFEYGQCDEVLPCTLFLEKPVTPDVLINKVASVLKNNQ